MEAPGDGVLLGPLRSVTELRRRRARSQVAAASRDVLAFVCLMVVIVAVVRCDCHA
jgi:hypothetical protein